MYFFKSVTTRLKVRSSVICEFLFVALMPVSGLEKTSVLMHTESGTRQERYHDRWARNGRESICDADLWHVCHGP